MFKLRSLRATKSQRFFAYLIDFIILSLVTTIFTTIIYKLCHYDVNTKSEIFNAIIKEIMNYLNYSSVGETYDFTYLFSLIKEYLRYYFFEFGIEAAIAFIYCALYFVVLPKYWGSQTVGRLAMKIKVVGKNDEALTWKNLILREIVGTFLLYIIINFPSIMIATLILTIYSQKSLVDYIGGTLLVSTIYKKEEPYFENKRVNDSDNVIDAEYKNIDSTNDNNSDDFKTF